MRVWRALKAGGAGILRDGVYVLPESDDTRLLMREQANGVEEAGGVAYLLTYCCDDTALETEFRDLFDRSAAYDEWLERVVALTDGLGALGEPEARRKEAQLRRAFESIAATDYFPGESQTRAAQALAEMAAVVNTHFSPDEPTDGRRSHRSACRLASSAGDGGPHGAICGSTGWRPPGSYERFIDPAASFPLARRTRGLPGGCRRVRFRRRDF